MITPAISVDYAFTYATKNVILVVNPFHIISLFITSLTGEQCAINVQHKSAHIFL